MLKIFLCGPFKKIFPEFVIILLLFCFWSFGPEVCEILATQPRGSNPRPLRWKAKSQGSPQIHIINKQKTIMKILPFLHALQYEEEAAQ